MSLHIMNALLRLTERYRSCRATVRHIRPSRSDSVSRGVKGQGSSPEVIWVRTPFVQPFPLTFVYSPRVIMSQKSTECKLEKRNNRKRIVVQRCIEHKPLNRSAFDDFEFQQYVLIRFMCTNIYLYFYIRFGLVQSQQWLCVRTYSFHNKYSINFL